MNLNQSFIRKISYIAGIALLLFPLFLLGQPSTGKRGGQGGKLVELRDKYSLSQAQLGEIDPVSEAVKLATLGMRGIAVVIMWDKATEYKKTEDFDNLKATLDQLTKLAPNFLTFWEHQAHNLAYNSSVEFDDYRDRYRWVKKGIEFLIEGTRYNRNQPRLLQNVAWYFGHKLGRSDEKLQFRALFREDEDFHKFVGDHVEMDEARGPGAKPDNWLVGRLWFIRAEDAIEGRIAIGGRLTPLLLYSQRPMSLINFAGSLEEEGKFDDESQAAYARALQDWKDYGNREIPTPFGHNIVLNDLDKLRKEVEKYRRMIRDIAPKGALEARRKAKIADLSEDHRQALETPEKVRTEQQRGLAEEAQMLIFVPAVELATLVPEKDKAQAAKYASIIAVKRTMLERIQSAHERVNFSYWRTRCQVEQTSNAIKARQLIKEAGQLLKAAQLQKAKAKYEEAWDVWHQIFKEYPALERDVMAIELMDAIQMYFGGLEQLELDIPPKGFKLARLLQIHDLNPNQVPAGRVRVQDLPDRVRNRDPK